MTLSTTLLATSVASSSGGYDYYLSPRKEEEESGSSVGRKDNCIFLLRKWLHVCHQITSEFRHPDSTTHARHIIIVIATPPVGTLGVRNLYNNGPLHP